jgi:disulfide bond formation protein DsbB
MKNFLKEYGNYMVWAIAFAGMAGSLYFSEIMGLVPCVLCWYQRIALYPLVILVGLGIIRKNPDLPRYVLPFSVIGLGVAVFHNLLYYGVIEEKLSPCTVGASCVDPASQAIGSFVTIPLLSLIGFLIITLIMLINLKGEESNA